MHGRSGSEEGGNWREGGGEVYREQRGYYEKNDTVPVAMIDEEKREDAKSAT